MQHDFTRDDREWLEPDGLGGFASGTVSGIRSRRYHALRDETERNHDAELDSEFEDVTEAYLDIEREIRKSEGRDRVASD